MKPCSRCKVSKSLESFSVCKRNKDGHLYTCKKCMNNDRDKSVSRRYYKKNRKRILARYKLDQKRLSAVARRKRKEDPDKYEDIRLRSWYGITKADFDTMAKRQGYKCKICTKRKRLCVDHDHKTKKVRGLLCSLCNQGLGLFKESQLSLKNATKYLRTANEP